jgi:polysaccharide export outer membrane protein
MKNLDFLLVSCIIVFAASCTGQKKIVSNYLENVRDTTAPISQQPSSPIIQKGDILSIRVYSMSLDPATDMPYNLPEQTGPASATATPAGFLVDHNGTIEYPRIGTMTVAGLTKDQLADTIKARLADQLHQPSVIIRFLNFKVTVLGEVRTPGTFTLSAERATILEALGQAGDMSEFGKRNTVKVVREAGGNREIGVIDLTTKDMFNSPYYHLQQNDVVFVEQSGRRQKQQEQQNLAQQIGIATSVITAIALILNFIK